VLTINLTDEDIDQTRLERRAETEMRRRRERRETASTQGWGLSDGQIRALGGTGGKELFWVPNIIIPVSMPGLGLNDKLLIAEVEQEAGPDAHGHAGKPGGVFMSNVLLEQLAARVRNLFVSGALQKRYGDADGGAVQVKTHTGRVLEKKESFPYGFAAKAKGGRVLVFCQGGNFDRYEILPVLAGPETPPPELREGDATRAGAGM
jgi:hypothetical protein